jgi:hypothetical protein
VYILNNKRLLSMGFHMSETTKNEGNRLVYDVPEAGAKIGLSRNASYAAAARGDFGKLIKVGKLLKVPKRPFDRMLGVED